MTRVELLVARQLIKKLAARDHLDHMAGSNPGAYVWIEDQIAQLLADAPRPEGFVFGKPARVDCGATGRYLYEGTALWRSGMDNSLMISEVVTDREAVPIVLPSDDEFYAAAEVFTHFLPGAMA
jgi:hypothetical protein